MDRSSLMDNSSQDENEMEVHISAASNKPRSGRPKAAVWEHYDDLGRDHRSHRHIARCKYCQFEWPSARVSQLKNHVLVACKKIDPSIRAQFLDMENAMNALEAMNSKNKNHDSEGREEGDVKPSHKRKLDSLSGHAVGGSADDVHSALLKWFSTAGIPFESVDNPHLAKALRILNPSYLCPSSMMLSGPLLQREFRTVQTNLAQKIATEETLSVGFSGHIEMGSTYVLSVHVIFSEKKAVFLKAFDFPLSEGVHAVIAEKVSGCISELGREKVVGVVTNRCPSLLKAVKEVCSKNEGLLRSVCFLHAFGDLMTACLSSAHAERIVFSSHTLASVFTHSESLYSLLVQVASSYQLPVKLVQVDVSDLLSVVRCLRTIKTLEKAFRKIGSDHKDKLPSDVSALLESAEFWATLTPFTNFMFPLHSALRYAQSAEATLSGAVALWVQITLHVERSLGEFPETFRVAAFQTMNAITGELNSTVCRLALYLDPRFRTTAVKEEGFKGVLRVATEVMKNRGYSEEDCRNFCNQWFPYKDNAAPYCELPLGLTHGSVKLWWMTFRNKAGTSLLSALGVLVADMPTHIGGAYDQVTLRGALLGESLRSMRDLSTAVMVQTVRAFTESFSDPRPELDDAMSAHAYVRPEDVKAALQHCAVAVNADKKAVAAAAKPLDKVAGVHFDTQTFSHFATAVMQGDSSGSSLISSVAKKSGDFNVDDLIMEFDA